MSLFEKIKRTSIEAQTKCTQFLKNDKGKPIFMADDPLFYELACAVVSGDNNFVEFLKIFINSGYVTDNIFNEFLNKGEENGYGMFNFLEEIDNNAVDFRIKCALLRHFFNREFRSVIDNLLILAMRQIRRENK